MIRRQEHVPPEGYHFKRSFAPCPVETRLLSLETRGAKARRSLEDCTLVRSIASQVERAPSTATSKTTSKRASKAASDPDRLMQEFLLLGLLVFFGGGCWIIGCVVKPLQDTPNDINIQYINTS